MRAPWNRAAAIALAACGLSLLAILSGCKTDVQKQDEAVSAQLNEAARDLQSGDKDAADKAQQAAQKAAANAGASKASQVEANSMMAQAELAAADDLVRQIERQEVELVGLASVIDQLGAQIDLNNANVTGYKSLEPTAGQKAIAAIIESAQNGTEGGVWVKGEAPVPALAQVKEREQKLDGQIKELTQQKDELSAKRAQALQEADRFDRQAVATTGHDAVGFYIQASNQRKEAADNDTRIAQLNAQLAPLQEELALAQAQQKLLESAVQSFQDQSSKLQAGWQNILKQIDATNAFSNSLLSGGGPAAGGTASAGASTQPAGETESGAPATQPSSTPQTPRSLSELAAAFENVVKSIEANRTKTIELLNSALGHCSKAESAGQALTNELSNALKAPNASKLPEKNAWQAMLDLNLPSTFKLREAAVQTRLARVYLDEYSELAQRNRLAAMLSRALKDSGLTAPQSVSALASVPATQPSDVQQSLARVEKDASSESPNFTDDQKTLSDLTSSQTSPIARQAIAAAEANLAYAWADNLLSDAINSPGAGDAGTTVANLAHAAHLSMLYGWGVFGQMLGHQQAYDSRLKRAKDDRDALAQANARNLLPPVPPPGLEFPPTTQPTTAPSGTPTTEPAAPATEPTAPTTEPAGVPTGAAPATEPAGETAPATQPTSPTPTGM